MYIPDELLDRFLAEDVPYFDLTTHLLDIGGQEGVIRYVIREEAVVCGTEEVGRMLARLGATAALPSGALAQPGQTLLEARGPAQALHAWWKAGQNLLDDCSAVATKTQRVVELVRGVSPPPACSPPGPSTSA